MEEIVVLRGFIANIDMFPPLIFTFQFNPKSISDNKKVNYVDQNSALCGNSPGKFYIGGGDRIISFSFNLHGLEQGLNMTNPTGLDNGISTELAKLRSFLYPRADLLTLTGPSGAPGGHRMASPPTCYFGFGLKIVEGTIIDMQINETQFNSFLAPVRADVSVTIAVMENDGNKLYELDKTHRGILSAIGLQNVKVF